MYQLKLYHNWVEELQLRPKGSKNKRIKEVIKLVAQCKVIEEGQGYTIYQLKESNKKI